MTWSIQQVSRLSKVTARTLRYYDEIGLLTPARVGANGYRYYEHEHLSRLQQILLLRDLGLDLSTIAAVIDTRSTRIETLTDHHRRLLDERNRLDRLITTVDVTIDHLQKGTDMPADKMFQGFEMSRDYIAEVEAARIEKTGETDQPELAEVKRNTADWSADDFGDFNAEGDAVTRAMVTLLRDGAAPDSPEAFAVLDDDMVLQRKLWSPTKAGYLELAVALDEPSELRSYYDEHDPRLAEYLRDAMIAYAEAGRV